MGKVLCSEPKLDQKSTLPLEGYQLHVTVIMEVAVTAFAG